MSKERFDWAGKDGKAYATANLKFIDVMDYFKEEEKKKEEIDEGIFL